MLSRVADSIYWMNRYVERAENIARFVDVNLTLLLDSPIGTSQQWKPLVLTTGDLPIFEERYGEASAENVIRFLTFDRAYPNSIISCLNAARENARSVREIISSEMWQQINAFYHFVNDAANEETLNFQTFFSEVKLASHLFAGVASATMTHNDGWHFGLMGRLLERADKTSRIVDVKYFILLPSVKDVGTTLDQLQWIALLRSASAYEMYRKRGLHRITPTSVAEFLVLDREFPRSIRYCIRQAERSLHQITGTPEGTWNTEIERYLGKLRSDLDYLTISDVMESGLHEFLDNLQRRTNEVGIKLSETFFAMQPVN
ncbi:alpha-E domain-containing protein [Cyanobacteria bacterium FACHB-DQ100]|uniref:alpha-E domain-containing protein n=1 Tax=unclassified Leptolyngbya TaxID=2650499 RepID=UPI001681699B|nr:alpha-E domain-containing protein [Leptolyngbya sp. FACHB-17]MBD1821685.1 alpha-E domain-containing protein [Cyanobacteria bacterium FACHB-DQ100]MBD2080888.1 alpha-E domain-containing protein [Leptolyngbya sp. FACHB-17]